MLTFLHLLFFFFFFFFFFFVVRALSQGPIPLTSKLDLDKLQITQMTSKFSDDERRGAIQETVCQGVRRDEEG